MMCGDNVRLGRSVGCLRKDVCCQAFTDQIVRYEIALVYHYPENRKINGKEAFVGNGSALLRIEDAFLIDR